MDTQTATTASTSIHYGIHGTNVRWSIGREATVVLADEVAVHVEWPGESEITASERVPILMYHRIAPTGSPDFSAMHIASGSRYCIGSCNLKDESHDPGCRPGHPVASPYA